MQCLLIAHPESRVREEVDSLLNGHFSSFLEEENGKDALKAVVSSNPDVLVVALNLPVLNGLSLVKILTLLGLKIPVVLLTEDDEVPAAAAKYDLIKKVMPLYSVQSRLKDVVAEIGKNFVHEYYDLEFKLERDEILSLLSAKNKQKVLIIDPDEDYRAHLADQINDLGDFEVFFAKCGQEGLLKSVMIKPDLVLTEQDLPQIDGVSMVQVLIVLGHSCPLLFITNSELGYLRDQTSAIPVVKGIFDKKLLSTEPALLTAALKQNFQNALDSENKKS
ncbi:MAG: response regulator, partial [SAR324 cluster bacterium]|nr:response regulator [SAR324 cluster bacterium]